MSTDKKKSALQKVVKDPHSTSFKIGIVVSDYHSEITTKLLDGCINSLIKKGVPKEHINIHPVPGAYELPLGAKWVYEKKKTDAVICLGCVIKGETPHHEYINHAVAQGLMNLSIHHGAPFVFGVLTTNNMKQAKARAGGKKGNKGSECALAAVQMLLLKHKLTK